MKTKDLQSIRTSLEVIKMHTAFIQDSANAMEIEEAAKAIQRHVSLILAITGKEEASTSEFVPCRTDYHVCASCLQVIRSLAYNIEGESEEDRPFPEADDAWNLAKDSGLLCGGDHCSKAKKWQLHVGPRVKALDILLHYGEKGNNETESSTI